MFYFLKATYLDLLSFLKNPADQPEPVQSRSEKAKKLLSLLIIDIPIMVILMGVLYGLEALGLFKLDNNKFNLLFLTIPVWPLIFILVILIPFIEELIFRLYLRYKTNYLLRFLVFTTSVTGEVNHEKAGNWAKQFWIRRYKVIFYFSAVLFGLVHITNYGISPMILLFAPIIVAPQFVAGLLLGYIRVRHGVISGFLLHAMHNAIFACIPLLFMGSASQICIDSKDYSMEIVKSETMPVRSFIRYYADSVIMNQASIKSILTEVLNKDESLIKYNNEPFMNTLINLKIKNKHLNDTLHRKDINYQLHRKNILDQLSKSYGFKIVNEFKNQDVWELCLIDSALLEKYVTDSIKSNRIDAFAGEITSTNTGMWHLSKALSQACNKHIVNKTGTKKKYVLKLQTNDFEALQKQLSAEYGLTLKQATKEVEFTTIEF